MFLPAPPSNVPPEPLLTKVSSPLPPLALTLALSFKTMIACVEVLISRFAPFAPVPATFVVLPSVVVKFVIGLPSSSSVLASNLISLPNRDIVLLPNTISPLSNDFSIFVKFGFLNFAFSALPVNSKVELVAVISGEPPFDILRFAFVPLIATVSLPAPKVAFKFGVSFAISASPPSPSATLFSPSPSTAATLPPSSLKARLRSLPLLSVICFVPLVLLKSAVVVPDSSASEESSVTA